VNISGKEHRAKGIALKDLTILILIYFTMLYAHDVLLLVMKLKS
jgi:hypothetical protein